MGVAFPSVTEELLQEVVRRIVSVSSPNKIVLFGSWARGQARPDSDLDLLIIEASALPRHRRARRHRMALLGLFPAKDIVVWTPDEVAQWQHVPNAFITTILAKGRVLYERSDRSSAWLAAQGS
ncbi:MAG: nucleotidyltransferase domain-containing protein [Gammaproteobacteria bacterium]